MCSYFFYETMGHTNVFACLAPYRKFLALVQEAIKDFTRPIDLNALTSLANKLVQIARNRLYL